MSELKLHLYLVHCGFYDQEVCDGAYEGHANFFTVAESFEEARAKVKQKPEFQAKKMHVDGLQEILAVDGYSVVPLTMIPLSASTAIITHRFRELAPKKNDNFVDTVQRALKAAEDIPPEQRFQQMVDIGLICPKGCVLAYGAFECDPERHRDS